MRSLRVVPEEPVDELFVELMHVITQEWKVVLYEPFRNRSVESLDGTVHLGAPWVRVVVANVEFCARIVEMVGKLAAVVGLYFRDGERNDFNKLCQEVCGSL